MKKENEVEGEAITCGILSHEPLLHGGGGGGSPGNDWRAWPLPGAAGGRPAGGRGPTPVDTTAPGSGRPGLIHHIIQTNK